MKQVISFRHIEVLRAVFLAGSVTGAAERLSVTQPAVSHIIKDAEERLEFPLFARQLGRLVPTEKGQMLWAQIQNSFAAFESINDFCIRLRTFESRDIVISSVPTVSTAILPTAMQQYRESIGNNFFVIRPNNTEDAIAAVRYKTADIAFGTNLKPVPGVDSTVIGQYDVLCFLPPEHDLSSKDILTPDDLNELPRISSSKLEGIDQAIESVIPNADQTHRAVVECPSAITAAAMVETGIGYALLDPITAHIYRHSRIVIRPFEPNLTVTIRAYWPDAEEPHFDRKQFLEFAKKQALKLSRLSSD